MEKEMQRTKQLLKHARTLWNSPLVPRRTARHNRKAWVRSVLRLGERWLLAKPVGRIQ
jgi:hypothetical protein